MLYVKIGNNFVGEFNTWSNLSVYKWGQLSTYKWKDLFVLNSNFDKLAVLGNTISINDQINDASTIDLKIFDEDIVCDFKRGMPISVYNDQLELIFSGFVTSVVKHQIGDKNNVAMSYTISGIDNHYIVNKRYLIKAFDNEVVTDAVEYIFDTILESEGISVGLIVPSNATITKSYNYIVLTDILNELAEYAGYIWFIDCNKKLYFIPKTEYSAPFDIILDAGGKCKYVMNDTFNVSDENSEFSDVVYIVGSTNKSVLQTRHFTGNGVNQTFTVPLPIAEQPTIYLNDVLQTVGITGVNTSGYQWYWNKGAKEISQDLSGTPITSTDDLKIEFIGFYSIVVKSSNFDQIKQKALLEGTTGINEKVITDSSYTRKEDALERANVMLNTYGIDSTTITYKTDTEGLEAGQLQNVYSSIHNIDHQCLITNIVKSEVDFAIEYDVTLVKGPVSDYWVRQFMLATTAKQKSLQQSIEESEVLLILLTYDKNWVLLDDPNIFKPLYPSDTTFPGNIDLPCFDEDECCSYIEINISGGYRSQMVDQVITDDQIITTFIIPSDECNGSFSKIDIYGGNLASMTLGSGVKLSTHNITYTKNSLESLQIVVTYNRWY